MFLIFGIQEIKRTDKDRLAITGSCPNCRAGNLTPVTYRRWFTLFFIPVIPIGSAKLFYECNQCKNLFDEHFVVPSHQPKEEPKVIIEESQLVFYRAFISSMTYLAISKGYISSKEEKLLYDAIHEFPNFTQELNSIKTSIVSHGNKENQVFEYLYDAKDTLSKEEIKKLLQKVANILTDANVSSEQETLMKEFLIACGLPKEIYLEIIQNS